MSAMRTVGVIGALLWGVAGANAQERAASDVKALKDLSYGPDERNVLDLYLPESGGGPRPLIVCIHGGGWAGGGKDRYKWLAEAFVWKGFVAASITYRFAPKWRSPAAMDDVQRAVRWLRMNADKHGIDPARVGAIGGSAGGHLASYLALAEPHAIDDPALAAHSPRVQAVVDCYGPVDFVGMMSSASAPIVESFMGMPLQGNEDAYRKSSPVHHVKASPPPFLIVHGTADVGTKRGQVPMEQSKGLHEKLKAAGGDSTLLLLEGAPHGFSTRADSPHAEKTLEAALEFFTRVLKP